MPEIETRKSLTVKLRPELLNRFNAAVKRQGLKNQFVVEQLVAEYVMKIDNPASTAEDDGFYDEANIRRLERSLEHAKQGKVIIKTMEELERMADE